MQLAVEVGCQVEAGPDVPPPFSQNTLRVLQPTEASSLPSVSTWRIDTHKWGTSHTQRGKVQESRCQHSKTHKRAETHRHTHTHKVSRGKQSVLPNKHAEICPHRSSKLKSSCGMVQQAAKAQSLCNTKFGHIVCVECSARVGGKGSSSGSNGNTVLPRSGP